MHSFSEMPTDIEPALDTENFVPRDNHEGARVRNEDSSSAQTPLFPAVYGDNVLRIDCLQYEKELSIKARTMQEIRTYNFTEAQFERNYDTVMDIDKSREFCSNVRSGKRRIARKR